MAIDHDTFLNWAESRFDGDVKVDGKGSIRLNSVFTDDYKHHMYCHTDPQIKDGTTRPHGTFHCFKTGQKGSLLSLVIHVDRCTFEEALQILEVGDGDLRRLERELKEFLKEKREEKRILPEDVGLQLPPHSYPILELPDSNYYRISAEIYLLDRKLRPSDYYVCISGDYKNRIVIPYYDVNKKLVYWNTRIIGDPKGDILRYRGPESEVGIGKSDVVYVRYWPSPGETIYLTEGEFDADSLRRAGLYAGALGGKNFSENQSRMLRPYKPVICLDNDSSGRDALRMVGDNFLSRGFNDLLFVRPAKSFKDWNKMLVELSPELLKSYVLNKAKPFTQTSSIKEWIKHFEPKSKKYNSRRKWQK